MMTTQEEDSYISTQVSNQPDQAPDVAWKYLLIPALMVLAGFLAWSYLPEQVPSRWNFQGEVEGRTPRLFLLAFMPAITLMLWVLFSFLPRLDCTYQSNYRRFAGTARRYNFWILSFMGLIHGLMLLVGLGWLPGQFVPRLIVLLMCGLMIVIGNEMGRLKPNPWFGIRLPWTMNNPLVWQKTHRVAGWVTVLVYGVVALFALLLPLLALFVALMVATVVMLVVSVGYSYYLHRVYHQAQQHPN